MVGKGGPQDIKWKSKSVLLGKQEIQREFSPAEEDAEPGSIPASHSEIYPGKAPRLIFNQSHLCIKKATFTVSSAGHLSVMLLLLAFDISNHSAHASAPLAGLLLVRRTQPSQNLAHDALPAKCQSLHASLKLNLSPHI